MQEKVSPELDFAVQDRYLQHLSPLFTPLSEIERGEDWGREYAIGLAFARELDLYQAITCFKRANILIPETLLQRKAEIQYQIINCYYLGKRYQEAIDSFEHSVLANTDRNFLAFHDLLIILFESYQKCDEPEKAAWMQRTMKKHFPQEGQKLALTLAILNGDLPAMESLSSLPPPTLPSPSPDLHLVSDEELTPTLVSQHELALAKEITSCQEATKEILKTFHAYKKSPFLAGALNGLIPGAGYLYLGQKSSAFTAFCLNSLFIGATTYFMKEKNYPAAAICLSFETGWYLGGIQGAHMSAKYYNNRLFENKAHYEMRDHKLFPILMLSHGF